MKRNIFLSIAVLTITLFGTAACQNPMLGGSFTGNDTAASIAVDDYLVFWDVDEVKAMLTQLDEVSISQRKSIEKLANFNSMMDAFLAVEDLSTPEELNRFLDENLDFLKIREANIDGQDVNLVDLKVDLLFACLISPKGFIQVGDTLYNLIQNEAYALTGDRQISQADFFFFIMGYTLQDIASKTINPIVDFFAMVSDFFFPDPGPGVNPCADGGEYLSYPDTIGLYPNPFCVFTSLFVQGMPMSPLIRTANYPTTYFQAEVNGQPCTVQLWKGYLVENGIGAEIGIYTPAPGSIGIWFPSPQAYTTDISYRLKLGDQVVFETSGHTWWLNKWKTKNLSALPLDGNLYTLEYHIKGLNNGENRVWEGTYTPPAPPRPSWEPFTPAYTIQVDTYASAFYNGNDYARAAGMGGAKLTFLMRGGSEYKVEFNSDCYGYSAFFAYPDGWIKSNGPYSLTWSSGDCYIYGGGNSGITLTNLRFYRK